MTIELTEEQLKMLIIEVVTEIQYTEYPEPVEWKELLKVLENPTNR